MIEHIGKKSVQVYYMSTFERADYVHRDVVHHMIGSCIAYFLSNGKERIQLNSAVILAFSFLSISPYNNSNL